MTTKKKAVEIVVDPGNARVHDERNQQVIQQSLRELGAGRSIVIDKAGQVIAGNETYRQAKALGLPVKIVESDGQTLIVVQRKDLAPEDERRRALAIADNRTSDLSEFNMGILADTLKAAGPELRDAMGFTEKELAQVFRQAQPKELKDPPAPPAPEEPRTQSGQLFSLGAHRLLCGDATKKKDVKRLMADQEAGMVFTDPPWNVSIGLDSNPRHRQRPGLVNDSLSPKEFETFLSTVGKSLAEVLAGDLYCVLGCENWPRLDQALRGAGFHWSATLIWAKDIFVLGRSNYHRRYEPIWYGWPGSGKSSYLGGRSQDDVWEFPRPKRSPDHPTMKPVELVARAVQNSSKAGDIVYDPFLGSGTTLIAADQLERVCYGLEIDPGYCDVIIRRYAEFKEIDVEGIYATANVG